MKDWIKDLIPVIQSLLSWPVCITLYLFCLRKPILKLLNAVAQRVDYGDTLEAGTSGIKLIASGTTKGELLSAINNGLPNVIYMSHKAVRDSKLDTADKKYYRLRIYLDADTPEILDKVEKVIYHLHPTFKNAERAVVDRQTSFEITTIAYGEFNMTAEISFKEGAKPLTVERYINFF